MASGTCLVTGVAGFIGSRIAAALLASGYRVIGLDDLSVGKLSAVPSGVDFINRDVNDPGLLALLPAKVDYILHLAGQSSGERSFGDPVADARMNYLTSLSVSKIALDSQARRIVHASSMSVYGASKDNQPFRESDPTFPSSFYGVSKVASELQLGILKMPSISFRMFNVYGPGQDLDRRDQGMVSIFLAQAMLDGSYFVKGSLERVRDFIYIDDVVEAWLQSLHVEIRGQEVYNLGTGVGTSVAGLLSSISRVVGEIPMASGDSTPGDQEFAVADMRKFESVFGRREVTSLEQGVSHFANFLRDNFAQGSG